MNVILNEYKHTIDWWGVTTKTSEIMLHLMPELMPEDWLKLYECCGYYWVDWVPQLTSYQDDNDGFSALKSIIFTEPSVEDLNIIIVAALKKGTCDSVDYFYDSFGVNCRW